MVDSALQLRLQGRVYRPPGRIKQMKYMLLMYASESETTELTPEESQAIFQDWQTLLKEAKDAGVLLSNTGLSPVSNATTVRVRANQTLCTDGPFAETHEQLG